MNIGGPRISNAQREQIIQAFLNNPEAGTKLATDLGLASTYAWKLVHSRGLMPRQGKYWGKLSEVSPHYDGAESLNELA